MQPALTILLLALLPGAALADTLLVPAEHGTIQAAIAAAGPGDTILVAPGTYRENLDFGTKELHLLSTDGPETTILDGQGLDTVVLFDGGQGHSACVEGFTIRGGAGSGSFGLTTRGGGITCQNGSGPSLIGNIIRDNTASWGGGLVCVGGSAPRVLGNEFRDNVIEHFGGGIMIRSSSPTIMGNLFSGNVAGTLGGSDAVAGVYVADISNAVLVGNLFEDNVALGNGGAVGVNNGSQFGQQSTTIIRGNVFRRNAAGSQAGAVWITRAEPVIENNVFEDNSAAEGGALVILDSTVSVRGNVFLRNSATLRGGAAYVRLDSEVDWQNNTLVSNSSDTQGGGLTISDSKVVGRNSIAWDNTAPVGPEARLELSASLDLSYSDVRGGQASVAVDAGSLLTWGAGMLDEDPMFLDRSADRLQLSADSPCVDGGDPLDAPLDLDLTGGLRLLDGDLDGVLAIDMGAFERSLVRLSLVGDPAAGDPLKLEARGPEDFQGFLIAGLAGAPTPVPPLGALQLAGPPFVLLRSVGSLPATVKLEPPPAMPGLVFQIAGLTEAGTGQLSNPVALPVD